ncbi:MAG: DoxX family protein [Planctomycetes bacterium]|nr:DoxX family protein [Planctomycetota bacterium]
MSLIDRLQSPLLKIAAVAQHAAPLVARLVVGQGFVITGYGKLNNIPKVTTFFSELGIPAPGFHAYFIGALECFGGAALIFGLATRAFSLLLTCTMIVAMMTADRAGLLQSLRFGGDKAIDVTPVPFLLPLLFLIAFGAGAISIDRFFGKRGN